MGFALHNVPPASLHLLILFENSATPQKGLHMLLCIITSTCRCVQWQWHLHGLRLPVRALSKEILFLFLQTCEVELGSMTTQQEAPGSSSRGFQAADQLLG